MKPGGKQDPPDTLTGWQPVSEVHLGGRSHGHRHESVQRTHHRWDDGDDPRGLLEEDVTRLGHSDSEARGGRGSRAEGWPRTVDTATLRPGEAWGAAQRAETPLQRPFRERRGKRKGPGH